MTAGEVLRTVDAEMKKPVEDADEHVLLLRDAILALVPAKAGEFPSVFSLGKKIGAMKDSVEGGLRIVAAGERDGTTLWKVERVVVPIREADEEQRLGPRPDLLEVI